jgi:hypothetical protein
VSSDDPDYVRGEYETEHGLAARASIYCARGLDARDVVIEELARSNGRSSRKLVTVFVATRRGTEDEPSAAHGGRTGHVRPGPAPRGRDAYASSRPEWT